MASISFSDLITFTRSSNATAINSSGLIQTVANNVPRFEYDPVTLESKGIQVIGGIVLNNRIKSIKYYNRNLSNTNLQLLTI